MRKAILCPIFVLVLLAFFPQGCGDGGDGGGKNHPRPDYSPTLALAVGIEEISASDFEAAGVAGAMQPSGPMGPAWWRLLDPKKPWASAKVARTASAPFGLLASLLGGNLTLPECAAMVTDPACSEGTTAGPDSCTTTVTFAPGCLMTIHNGEKGTFMMEGTLAHTTTLSGMGEYATDVARSFRVSNDAGEWMMFNGSAIVTSGTTLVEGGTAVIARWESPESDPATVENSRGDSLFVVGWTQTLTQAGTSVTESYDLHTRIVAGRKVRDFQRTGTRAITQTAPGSYLLTSTSTVTNLVTGESWARSLAVSVDALPDGTVRVNGSAGVTAPDGMLFGLVLQEVVFDDGMETPVSGSALVYQGGELIRQIDFSGQCLLEYTTPDGSTGGIDLCEALTRI